VHIERSSPAGSPPTPSVGRMRPPGQTGSDTPGNLVSRVADVVVGTVSYSGPPVERFTVANLIGWSRAEHFKPTPPFLALE